MSAPLSPLPEHVTVFVNWACNLRCRECWLYGDSFSENLWLRQVMKETLPLPLYEKLILELLAGRSRASIGLMGGEPFLHRDLARMVDFLKSRSPDSYIDANTNGTLLERAGEDILAAGLDMVWISLDGSTPEINDPIRGAGCFAKTLRGIDYYCNLRETYPGTRIGINFTITALNYRDLVNMVTLADELGADELSVNFAMFFSDEEGASVTPLFSEITGRTFASWKGFQNHAMAEGVDASELAAVIHQAEESTRAVRVLIAPTRYSAADRGKYFSPEWKSVLRETSCPKLSLMTTLLPNGDVISCTPFSDTVMGNLKEETLAEIWHGEVYRRLRNAISRGLTPICHRCCEINNDMDLNPDFFLRARASG